MLNITESTAVLESRFNDVYKNDLVVSRSFTSGINQSSISTNRLRVYSMDNKSPGPVRVRSSPSSPNRLSRFQCLPLIRKRWFALNKINQSSSSEFNSNKSLQCDSNIEQFDFSLKNDSSMYHLSDRPKSCQSLQTKDSFTQNEDDLYYFYRNVKPTIHTLSQTNAKQPTHDEIDSPKDNVMSHYRMPSESEKYYCKLSNSGLHNESLLMSSKLSSNPINFKKVLRDRYLNSLRNSNVGFFTSYSSTSSKISQSLTDDCLCNRTNFILPENEDHNFYLKEMNSRRSDNFDTYDPESMGNVNSKKSLSIDLQNSSSLKKYRILSNNSTISSMSGIEAEGDPFSPAFTEICSPFLKLHLPYQSSQKQMSECSTPNIVTSSSLGNLPLTHEIESNCSFKTIKFLSTQRFFPESMKLSDFHTIQTFKSDCQLDTNFKEQLMLPSTVNSHVGSKSAPQSLQLSPNCTNLLSGSITPIICPTTDSDDILSRVGIINSEEDVYFMRPITCSKSMDYLDSWNAVVNSSISKDLEEQYDWMKKDDLTNKTYESIKLPKIHHKPKIISILNQMPKKITPVASSSSQRQCTVCGRHFNRSDMLARHSRVHTGHKPFECSICGQSFSRSDHLNTHMRIHSGEKPYRCSLCSYSACRRDMITRHLRVHRRKGDVSIDSISVLVVNSQNTAANHQKYSLTKSNNSLNIYPSNSNDIEFSTIHRSQSFNDTNQSFNFPEQNSSSRTTEMSHTVPKTFANISISICQPTPRSSFSIPTESQNDS